MNSRYLQAPLIFLAAAFLLLTIVLPAMIASTMPREDAAGTATTRAQTPTPTLTPTAIVTEVELDYRRAMAGIFAGTNARTAHMLQIPAGGTLELTLGYEECCYVILPLENVTVEWTVSPRSAASIEPDTGILRVDEDESSGVVTVTATTHDGLTRSADIRIYDPYLNPLIGIWQEEARLDCETGEFIEMTEGRIGEVIFNAYYKVLVTWFPFEIFVDYAGEFIIDPETNTVLITINGIAGNLPEDFDGDGTYEIDDEGRLILRDISMGTHSSQDSEKPATCGHRFLRRR